MEFQIASLFITYYQTCFSSSFYIGLFTLFSYFGHSQLRLKSSIFKVSVIKFNCWISGKLTTYFQLALMR